MKSPWTSQDPPRKMDSASLAWSRTVTSVRRYYINPSRRWFPSRRWSRRWSFKRSFCMWLSSCLGRRNEPSALNTSRRNPYDPGARHVLSFSYATQSHLSTCVRCLSLTFDGTSDHIRTAGHCPNSWTLHPRYPHPLIISYPPTQSSLQAAKSVREDFEVDTALAHCRIHGKTAAILHGMLECHCRGPLQTPPITGTSSIECLTHIVVQGLLTLWQVRNKAMESVRNE